MTRDMDLVRLLLLQTSGCEQSDLKNYSKEQILYNKKLLLDKKLANGNCLQGDDKIVSVVLTGLTWDGNDFLDAIANDKVWNKTRSILKDKGVDLPFSVIKNLAIKIALEIFNLG